MSGLPINASAGDTLKADDELDAILAWGANETTTVPTEPKSHEVVLVGRRPRASVISYDPVTEEAEYSRALMSTEDLSRLKKDIDEYGFMTIEQIRDLVTQNTVKETQEARGETYAIDPEMMMQIDTRTDICVFITGDNVYTREELCSHYPFEAFQTTPEDVFDQQEIGVFPPKKWADPDKNSGEDAYEYVARDLGDSEEFIMIEDLVGRAARKNYKMRRAPIRIVKTKIFLGKDRWEEFTLMKRFVKSFTTFVAPLMVEGGDTPMKALTYLFGGRTQGPLAIQDDAGVALEREHAAQVREQTALRALEAKAEALQAKEKELRLREEELFQSLGLDPPKRPARDWRNVLAETDEEAGSPGGADDSVAL